MGLSGRAANGSECLGIQRGAADQAAIYVLLGEQLRGVVRLDAAAIQQAHACRRLGILRGQQLANVRVHRLGLRRAGGLAGANRPYRFVGDHAPGQLRHANLLQHRPQL
ncbi:hypothetical protein D3C79_697850 [compost metagenome]